MRRIKIPRVAFVLILLALWEFPLCRAQDRPGAAQGKCLVYVGTEKENICVCRMDLASGALSPLELAAETPGPSFLDISPGGRFLYSVNETGRFQGKATGAVSAFSINQKTGKLVLLNQIPSMGENPCHLALDPSGGNVLVANYSGGSIAVLRVQPDGRLGAASTFIQLDGRGINPRRQEKSHAHCATFDPTGHFAFVCDLGADRVMIYRFDPARGTLTANQPPFLSVTSGAGPRHLTFHPDGRHAWLVNELNSTVTALAWNPRFGTLDELQTVSTLPDDFKGVNTCAEVAVHPSGKFLYASNRGDDSIAIFSIDAAKGTLSFVARQSTQGRTPRHFAIAPAGNFLIAANQGSNSLVVFALDPKTGRLTPTGARLEVPSPECVKFLPFPPENLKL